MRKTSETRFLDQRRGIMLMLFAILLAPLLALVGLTIDGGRIYLEKRRMQAAADGGAFGAAREILRGNDGFVVSAGRDDTKLNGFDNDAPDITVTVNRPPLNGPNSGKNSSVEVIITRSIPTTFLKVLTKNNSTVRARAVAGVEAEWDPPCILALDPSAKGAITISGNVDIDVPECTMVAVSDDPQALTINGNVNVVTGGLGFGAPSNGYVQNGQGNVQPWPPTSTPGITDPYAGLEEPNPADYPQRSSKTLSISTDTILEPGYYKGGIKVTGGKVKLRGGLYIVDGLTVNGGSFGNFDPVGQAGGVTIFNTGAKPTNNILINGNVNVDLHATYTGTYANILFFNSYNAAVNNGSTSDAKLSGNASSTYDGIMYFPTVQVEYSGTATQDGSFAMIIGKTVEFSGTPQIGADWEGAGRTPSIQQVSLLE